MTRAPKRTAADLEPRGTDALVALDRRHLWHPFTHHGLWGGAEDPIVVIASAEGNELVDTEGRRYLDAISSLWCNTLGHRVPEIDAAVRAQLDRVAHSTLLGLSCEPAVLLAEELASLCPGDLERVFYTDAGATAVEVALKIAAQHARLVHGEGTRRRRFLTLAEAYHGDTLGAVSLGSRRTSTAPSSTSPSMSASSRVPMSRAGPPASPGRPSRSASRGRPCGSSRRPATRSAPSSSSRACRAPRA